MYLLKSRWLVLVTLIASSLGTPFVHDRKHNLFYQGLTTSPGVETFLGIPYGASTAGNNRFAPPQPFSAPSKHIFNATKAGPACPQDTTTISDPETPLKIISEDCLNLNVARPAGNYEVLLPVMVWIYGGEIALRGEILPQYMLMHDREPEHGVCQ